jgi:hypothetical protein
MLLRSGLERDTYLVDIEIGERRVADKRASVDPNSSADSFEHDWP